MIESIGYTEDGIVWARLLVNIQGDQAAGILQLSPDMARQVGKKLTEAADLALKAIGKGNGNERNREHDH